MQYSPNKRVHGIVAALLPVTRALFFVIIKTYIKDNKLKVLNDLNNSLHDCGQSYAKCLSQLPFSGYIHEHNLVTKYLIALEKNLGFDTVYWNEFPLGDRKRMDAVAYSESKNCLIMIEAKRIRQGSTKGIANYHGAIKQIKNDTLRMMDDKYTKKIINMKPDAKVYRIMLAQIWINKQTKPAHQEWMNKSIFSWSGKVSVAETKRINGNDDNELKLLIAIN